MDRYPPMPLSDEQYTLLQQILQGLEPEVKNLNPSSQNFVKDQLDRLDRYGQQILLSPKQWNWLKDLYEKNVGVLPGGEDDPDESEPKEAGKRSDIDDEIPF